MNKKYSNYRNRLSHALLYRGIEVKHELSTMLLVLQTRAKSDRELDGIFLAILKIIEPPYCQMTHCENHTSYGMCGCAKHLVPGRCKIHSDYLKRKRVKEEKIKKEICDYLENHHKIPKEQIESTFNNMLVRNNNDYTALYKKVKDGYYSNHVKTELP
jgi:hypothetical protein